MQKKNETGQYDEIEWHETEWVTENLSLVGCSEKALQEAGSIWAEDLKLP